MYLFSKDTENLLEFSRLSYCSIIKVLLSFFVLLLRATALLSYHSSFCLSSTFSFFWSFMNDWHFLCCPITVSNFYIISWHVFQVKDFFQKIWRARKLDEVLKSCCFVSNVDNLIIAAGKCQQVFLLFSHILLQRIFPCNRAKRKSPRKTPYQWGFPKAFFKI